MNANEAKKLMLFEMVMRDNNPLDAGMVTQCFGVVTYPCLVIYWHKDGSVGYNPNELKHIEKWQPAPEKKQP